MTTIVNRENINQGYKIDWKQRSAEYKPSGIAIHVFATNVLVFDLALGVAYLATHAITKIKPSGLLLMESFFALGAAKVLAIAAAVLLMSYALYKVYEALDRRDGVDEARFLVQDIRHGKIEVEKLEAYFNRKTKPLYHDIENLPFKKTDLDELLFKSEVTKLSYAEFIERYGSRGEALLIEERKAELKVKQLEAIAVIEVKKQVESEREASLSKAVEDKS